MPCSTSTTMAIIYYISFALVASISTSSTMFST